MAKKPLVHSIEVSIVREYPGGRKVTDRAIVKPTMGSYAQFGDAPGDIAAMNKPLLARFAHAAELDNRLNDDEAPEG